MLDALREIVLPSGYDDKEIDDIIWSEIKSSPSSGDFAAYLVHRPQKARHRDEASARFEAIDKNYSADPIAYPRAIERIRALAESGHAPAMFHMGKVNAYGIGCDQDLAVAVEWYRKGIAAGEMRAHCNLGWLYQSGYGVPEDKEEGFRLIMIGAKNGIPSAMASVGSMLLAGEGCQADPAKGLKMLEAAFDAGYNNAGNHLSDTYFSGQYVPKDVDLGHEWLFKVVARGDERTMAILGHYLVTGSHGKTDVKKGLALLHDAINERYLPAYLWLGSLYKNGNGVERDLVKAKIWFEQGTDEGDQRCEQALAKLLDGTARLPEFGGVTLH